MIKINEKDKRVVDYHIIFGEEIKRNKEEIFIDIIQH
jgi:hypothetical protein